MTWLPPSPSNSCNRISLSRALAATVSVQRQYSATTEMPPLLAPLVQAGAASHAQAFGPPTAPRSRAGRKRKAAVEQAPQCEPRNPKQMRREACEKAEAPRRKRESRELAQARMVQRKKEFKALAQSHTKWDRRARAQGMGTVEFRAMKDKCAASMAMDAQGRHLYRDADGNIDITAFHRDRKAQTAYNASPDGGMTHPFRKWDEQLQRLVGDTAAYQRHAYRRRLAASGSPADAGVQAGKARKGGPIIGR